MVVLLSRGVANDRGNKCEEAKAAYFTYKHTDVPFRNEALLIMGNKITLTFFHDLL